MSVQPTTQEMIDSAFELAALDVVERAERCGTSVVIWDNGAVVHVPPAKYRQLLLLRQQRRVQAGNELPGPESR